MTAYTAKMGGTAIQFGEDVTLLPVKGVFLPVDAVFVDVAGISRLIEEYPFEGFSLMFAKSKFVAHN